MKSFLGLLMVIIRIFIVVKVIYTLIMVKQDPVNYPMDNVIWWSGFLIFDMWISNMLPPLPSEDDDSHLEDFRK